MSCIQGTDKRRRLWKEKVMNKIIQQQTAQTEGQRVPLERGHGLNRCTAGKEIRQAASTHKLSAHRGRPASVCAPMKNSSRLESRFIQSSPGLCGIADKNYTTLIKESGLSTRSAHPELVGWMDPWESPKGLVQHIPVWGGKHVCLVVIFSPHLSRRLTSLKDNIES